MQRTTRRSLQALFAIMAMALAPAARAQSNDAILSRHVKEADGITAQDTNGGSGIKTGHLQNGAVTNAKLAAGAVTADKLGIVCPSGQYLQYTGTWTCSVGTPGPQGPAGPMGAEGPQGPQGPAGPAARYANVVVVAKSGGDFMDPSQALASIADASASNRYLVQIMPGEYAVPFLIAKDFVDVQGSGRNLTKLVSPQIGVNARYDSAGAFEFRDLEIVIDAQIGNARGIWIQNGSPRFTDVKVTMTSTGSDIRDAYGIYIDEGQPVFTRVEVDLQGAGTPGYSFFGVAKMSGALDTTPVVFEDSSIRVAGGQFTWGVYAPMGTIALRRTDVRAEDAPSSVGLFVGGAQGDPSFTPVVTFEGGSARGGTAAALVQRFYDHANLLVSGARLDGALQSNGILKTVHCHDAAFDPIADGLH